MTLFPSMANVNSAIKRSLLAQLLLATSWHWRGQKKNLWNLCWGKSKTSRGRKSLKNPRLFMQWLWFCKNNPSQTTHDWLAYHICLKTVRNTCLINITLSYKMWPWCGTIFLSWYIREPMLWFYLFIATNVLAMMVAQHYSSGKRNILGPPSLIQNGKTIGFDYYVKTNQ